MFAPGSLDLDLRVQVQMVTVPVMGATLVRYRWRVIDATGRVRSKGTALTRFDASRRGKEARVRILNPPAWETVA